MESDELTSDDTSSDGPRELECHCDITYFASTLPPLISSLPGQAQDMPPRCLHASTLLCSLLVDSSTGINLEVAATPDAMVDTPLRSLMCLILRKVHEKQSSSLDSLVLV